MYGLVGLLYQIMHAHMTIAFPLVNTLQSLGNIYSA
jgi:hypothetical protein